MWKLIYAHILGYPVDFGHDVAVNLINQPKFTDKSTGYIAMGIMLNEKTEYNVFANCIDAIKSDLTSGNESNEALALSTLGNIGSGELARELSPAILHKVFTDDRTTPINVKKKACMCLLSFIRRDKSIYDFQKFLVGFENLFSSTNYGLLLSSCSLLHAVIQIFGHQGYESLISKLVLIMQNINDYAQDYFYYMTPCPWL